MAAWARKKSLDQAKTLLEKTFQINASPVNKEHLKMDYKPKQGKQ